MTTTTAPSAAHSARFTEKRGFAAALTARQLEDRLGSRWAAALSLHSEQLSPDIGERLRFARMQALERARAARAVAGAGQVVGRNGATAVATWGGSGSFWQRAAALLPLLMLLAGLIAIDHWSAREQLVAVAEVDTQLLADDLPPAAYSDPGFVAYLRSAPLP